MRWDLELCPSPSPSPSPSSLLGAPGFSRWDMNRDVSDMSGCYSVAGVVRQAEDRSRLGFVAAGPSSGTYILEGIIVCRVATMALDCVRWASLKASWHSYRGIWLTCTCDTSTKGGPQREKRLRPQDHGKATLCVASKVTLIPCVRVRRRDRRFLG